MRKFLLCAVLVALTTAPLGAVDVLRGKVVYTRKTGEIYRLHVMNADGSEDSELPGQVAKVNFFAVWSPDGKKIAYTTGDKVVSQNQTVVICNADGSAPRPVPVPGSRSRLPVWSPDGKQ